MSIVRIALLPLLLISYQPLTHPIQFTIQSSQAFTVIVKLTGNHTVGDLLKTLGYSLPIAISYITINGVRAANTQLLGTLQPQDSVCFIKSNPFDLSK